MVEYIVPGTATSQATHVPAAPVVTERAPQVFVLAGVAALLVFIVLAVSVSAHFFCVRKNPEKEKRRLLKKRLRALDRAARPELFQDWYKQERKVRPDVPVADVEDQTCVICLEPIEKLEQIRALACRHIYHRQCFDDWFTGDHGFCPLCHRSVLPEFNSEKKIR